MRVVLHGVAYDVGDLDEPARRPFHAGSAESGAGRALAVFHAGNGAVADHVGGVLQEIAVYQALESGPAVGACGAAGPGPRRRFRRRRQLDILRGEVGCR